MFILQKLVQTAYHEERHDFHPPSRCQRPADFSRVFGLSKDMFDIRPVLGRPSRRGSCNKQLQALCRGQPFRDSETPTEQTTSSPPPFMAGNDRRLPYSTAPSDSQRPSLFESKVPVQVETDRLADANDQCPTRLQSLHKVGRYRWVEWLGKRPPWCTSISIQLE